MFSIRKINNRPLPTKKRKMGNTSWVKFLFGVGILAILSGIYFIIKGDSVEGITNIIIGVFVVFLSRKQIKDNNEK